MSRFFMVHCVYNEIIVVLNTGSNLYVSSRHKHFFVNLLGRGNERIKRGSYQLK